jgi:hypothetical protein
MNASFVGVLRSKNYPDAACYPCRSRRPLTHRQGHEDVIQVVASTVGRLLATAEALGTEA